MTQHLKVFGKHVADMVRYAIRGTSIYKAEEACDTLEKMVQKMADEYRAAIHDNFALKTRVAFLEKQLGIGQ